MQGCSSTMAWPQHAYCWLHWLPGGAECRGRDQSTLKSRLDLILLPVGHHQRLELASILQNARLDVDGLSPTLVDVGSCRSRCRGLEADLNLGQAPATGSPHAGNLERDAGVVRATQMSPISPHLPVFLDPWSVLYAVVPCLGELDGAMGLCNDEASPSSAFSCTKIGCSHDRWASPSATLHSFGVDEGWES